MHLHRPTTQNPIDTTIRDRLSSTSSDNNNNNNNTTTTTTSSPFKSSLAALRARLSPNSNTRSEQEQNEIDLKRKNSIKPFVEIELPPAADFHVHLRDGELMELVTPTIEKGGVGLVYVMPNLVPPITTPEAAISYMERLKKLSPKTTFLPTLYLHPSISPSVVAQAASLGVVGIKSYPRGLTTNSDAGVLAYDDFYPIFQAMSDCDMVLNLHGECPSTHDNDLSGSDDVDITILNAEAHFLPTFLDLHKKFPKLRIVLEHCTTAAAVEAVLSCGPTVAGTITAHHLFLTIDQWADNPHAFCKPVAKLPSDRAALLAAATSGNPKFFLGTDSAPHVKSAKHGRNASGKTTAGVFTQPYAVQLVAEAFDKVGMADKETLEGFCCIFGREFYKIKEKGLEGEDSGRRIVLKKGLGERVVKEIGSGGEDKVVVPFKAGEEVWSLEWQTVL